MQVGFGIAFLQELASGMDLVGPEHQGQAMREPPECQTAEQVVPTAANAAMSLAECWASTNNLNQTYKQKANPHKHLLQIQKSIPIEAAGPSQA